MKSISSSSNNRTGIQLLLLVVSLWVGPIPIGHTHACAIDSRMGGADLAQHVLFHHGGELGNRVDDQWHLHWVFRGSSYAGINGESSIVQAMSS